MRLLRLTALGLILVISACSHGQTPTSTVVQFPGAPPLQTEVASEPAAREKGLMFHPALKSGEAILLAFPEERPWPLWMKNVNFSIDIIWLNASGVVVHTVRAPPCRADPCPVYTPPVPALYVVETAAGFAANHSIGPGTKAGFQGGAVLRGKA